MRGRGFSERRKNRRKKEEGAHQTLSLSHCLIYSYPSEGRDHAEALRRQMMEIEAREQEVNTLAQSTDCASQTTTV